MTSFLFVDGKFDKKTLKALVYSEKFPDDSRGLKMFQWRWILNIRSNIHCLTAPIFHSSDSQLTWFIKSVGPLPPVLCYLFWSVGQSCEQDTAHPHEDGHEDDEHVVVPGRHPAHPRHWRGGGLEGSLLCLCVFWFLDWPQWELHQLQRHNINTSHHITSHM